MTVRQILVNVWQGHITPREALEELQRSDYKLGISRDDVLDMLEEVADKMMTVTAFLRAVEQTI